MTAVRSCGYDLCIYWEQGACSLEILELGPLGICEECIAVSLDEPTLREKRAEALAQLASNR